MSKNLGYSCLALTMIINLNLQAENLANPKEITPLKQFSPPPLINPNIALGYYPENQFDRTFRTSYYQVTDIIDKSLDPFHISGGYFDHKNYSTILLRARESNLYTTLNAHTTNATPYRNANGDKINFGYNRDGVNLILGYVFNPFNEIKFSFLEDNIKNDKQPQHTMDPLYTRRYVSKINYRLGLDDLSDTLNFDLSYIKLDREADNFSNRQNNANQVKMRVDRDIFNTSVKYDKDILSFHNLIGIGYTHDNHIAKRYAKANNQSEFQFNGYRFPDVEVDEFNLFDTIKYSISPAHTISIGLEYDYNKAKIKALNDVVQSNGGNNITPQIIWKNHYGDIFDGDINQDALSMATRYDFTPNDTQIYSLSLESIERIPSNDERFVSLNGANAQGWALNPNLNPERRNRIKTEFKLKNSNFIDYMSSKFDNDSWQIGGHFIADWANDFIILDRSKSTATKGNVISRNIDARLYSFNGNLSYNFLENFGFKTNIYYNYGENKSDNRPLYQIAPLEMTLNLDYQNYTKFGKYSIGAAMRAVASQNRGDFDKNSGLGIDNKTGGFAIFDLYASIAIKGNWGARFGVNNIFNKKYNEYISGSHVEAIEPSVVDAPGRGFYVSFNGKF